MFRSYRRLLILAGILVLTLSLVAYQVELLAAGASGNQVNSGGEIECVGGMAGVYPCEKVDFLSFRTRDELGTMNGFNAANVWGWTDPDTNIEYVLLSMTDTLAILDISDPENPVQIGHLPNHTPVYPDLYRDVKVYGNYAFVIADQFSDHGMQVFDLTQVRDVMTPSVVFSETAYFDGFGNGHNLFIHEETGYAYVVRTTDPGGTDPCGASVYMVDISDPLNPTFAGCFAENEGPASDTMCVIYAGPDVNYQGQEICLVASDDNILVGDLTDKSNPAILANLTYPDIARAHLAWFTEDHQYFVSADMNDEMMHGLNTRIFLWDITQVDAPELIGIWVGATPASDHNIWVEGDYAYVGNFRAGMVILDIADIASTTMTNVTVFQTAYFDMYPADNNAGHMGGAWAVYPYFDSGVVPVSDRLAGLYLLRPNLEVPTDVSLSGLTGDSAFSTWMPLVPVLLLAVVLLFSVQVVWKRRHT